MVRVCVFGVLINLFYEFVVRVSGFVVVCVFCVRVVCHICILFITWFMNVLCVWFCIWCVCFLCALRMMRVSFLCGFQCVFYELVVSLSAFVMCVLCVFCVSFCIVSIYVYDLLCVFSAFVVCDLRVSCAWFVCHFCVFSILFFVNLLCVFSASVVCVCFVWFAYGLRIVFDSFHYRFNKLGVCCSTFVLCV